MKAPVLTIRRADLVAAGACAEWLKAFDAICALRGLETAPIVRRGQIWRRDPQRLRIELTPLAQLWMARDAYGAVSWLRSKGVLGAAFAPSAALLAAGARSESVRTRQISLNWTFQMVEVISVPATDFPCV